MVYKLLKVVYAILFLATPLIFFPSTSELFEFNKMILIYALSACVFFLWSLEMLRAGKWIFRRTIFDIPLGLFLLSQILSTFFSIDVHTSLFGYYGRFNGGLLSIIAYILLYWGYVSHFDFAETKTFLKLSLLSSVLVMLWGLPGRFGHDMSCLLFLKRFDNSCWTSQFRPAERMFSTLGQPNWLGAYLAVHFFIGLYFLVTGTIKRGLEKVSWPKDLLLIAYLVLTFTSILFTRSRSSLLAVLVGSILFGLYVLSLLRRNQALKKPLTVLLLLTIVVVFFVKTGIPQVDSFLEWNFFSQKPSTTSVSTQTAPEFSSGGVTESFDIRKIVWKGAIDLFAAYPLFGTGPETFAYSYYFVRPVEHNLTSEWDFLYNKAHNEYLNYLATTGLFGFFAYLLVNLTVIALFVTFILKAHRSKTLAADEALFMTSLFFSYVTILITNFFGFSTTTSQLFFYLLPAMMVSLGYKKAEGVTTPFSLKRFLALLLTAVFFVFILFSLVRYVAADILYAEAETDMQSMDYQSAAQKLDAALRLKYEHTYEDRLSSVLAQVAYVAAYQKEVEVAQKLAELSLYYADHSLKASPKNVVYLKNKVKNYYFLYQIDFETEYLEKGVAVLSQASAISPTDPKVPYTEALFYSLLEDETEDAEHALRLQTQAIEAVDRSIKLKANYLDAYLLKGQLLKKFGKTKEARNVFEYALKNIDPTSAELKKQLEEL